MPRAHAPTPPPGAPAPRVLLLGRPRLVHADGSVHAIERRVAALLAALVLDGPLSREAAAARLWPRAGAAAARNSLRQGLFRLHTLAGRQLVGSGSVLTLAPGTGVDIGRDAARADTPPPHAVPAGAAPPHGDELLATLAYDAEPELADWVAQARRRWREGRVAALTRDAARHEAAGDLDVALDCTQRALRADPACEGAHAQAMRLHYLRGDRAAALRAWSACVAALREHDAAEPGPQTRALATLIRSGEAVGADAGAVPPAGVAAAVPAALRRPPRLVGRESAWAALQDALHTGHGVLISGAPGIGKSRLLDDFLHALAAPCPRHGGRPGDAAQPYASLQRLLHGAGVAAGDLPPWARAELARLVPEWGDPPAGPLQPLRLRRALALALRQLRERGQPLLAIDDFQFVDAPSQDLLLACLDPGDLSLPPLWAAVRSGEAPANLRQWLAQHAAHGVRELPLAPLDRGAVADFVASLQASAAGAVLADGSTADWAALLARRAGGNPLFMLQLVLASAGRLAQAAVAAPDELLRLVGQRLARLSPAALRVLRVTALAEPHADAALVAAVLGVHAVDLADAYAELGAADLLRGDGAFAFDAVGDAARTGVPGPVAQALHAALAPALQGRGAPPAVVAGHHQAAGRSAEAAVCLDAAAAQARAAGLRRVELSLHDRAAHAHRTAGDAAAAWRAAERALACAHTEEPPQALQARAAAVRDGADDDGQRLRAWLHLARLHLSASDPAAALHASAQALPLALAGGSAAQRLTAQGWHATALALTGQTAQAQALLAAALPAAHAEGDLRARLDFFGAMGYTLHVAGRFADAAAPLRTAVDAALELGELGDALEQSGNLAVCCSSCGDRAGELRAVEDTLAVWRRMGEPEGLAADTVLVQACTSLLPFGRYDEVLAVLPAVEERLARDGPTSWAVIAGHRLAGLYLRLGQPARARQALRPLPPDASRGARAARVLMEARIDAHGGRRADAALRRALHDGGAMLEPLDRQALTVALAELTPDDDEALALTDALLAACGAADSAPAWRQALLHRARRLHRLGRAAAALDDLRQAWAGPPPHPALGADTAETCRLAATLAQALGDDALAAAALQEGLAWLAATEPRVPPAFVDSFRHRNPGVQGLRALAARLQPA